MDLWQTRIQRLRLTKDKYVSATDSKRTATAQRIATLLENIASDRMTSEQRERCEAILTQLYAQEQRDQDETPVLQRVALCPRVGDGTRQGSSGNTLSNPMVVVARYSSGTPIPFDNLVSAMLLNCEQPDGLIGVDERLQTGTVAHDGVPPPPPTRYEAAASKYGQRSLTLVIAV